MTGIQTYNDILDGRWGSHDRNQISEGDKVP